MHGPGPKRRARAGLFSPAGFRKSDRFSFNPGAPQRFAVGGGGSSLRPIAAHCRPGVKSQLPVPSSKAPCWDSVFPTEVDGGARMAE